MDQACTLVQTFERLRTFPRNNWSRATIGLACHCATVCRARQSANERGAGARLEGGDDQLFEFIVPAVPDARRWASRISDATEGPAGTALARRYRPMRLMILSGRET